MRVASNRDSFIATGPIGLRQGQCGRLDLILELTATADDLTQPFAVGGHVNSRRSRAVRNIWRRSRVGKADLINSQVTAAVGVARPRWNVVGSRAIGKLD